MVNGWIEEFGQESDQTLTVVVECLELFGHIQLRWVDILGIKSLDPVYYVRLLLHQVLKLLLLFGLSLQFDENLVFNQFEKHCSKL